MGRALLASLLCLVLLAGQAWAAKPERILIDDFAAGLRPQWEEKSFRGRTDYQVVADGESHCLRAESHAAASGLIFPKTYSLRDYPYLSWRWRVDNVIPGGDERRKSGDDYAARVYVIFPHWLPLRTRSINYIWANQLPQGEFVPNPFFSGAVMVAVQSGESQVGTWQSERRNVLEDYRRIFGEEPPKVGAIAVMTDTDNTGRSAVACYADIWISAR